MIIKIYKQLFIKCLLCAAFFICLSSCYSVRIISRDGVPQPDYTNNSPDFYKNKMVLVIDTTIRLKVHEGDFSLIKGCSTQGFYALEYRMTFGDVLVSGITFGKVRKVRVKYVCIKEN
ncbi:hypothetical protein GS399_11010 [Pedobacter sp. HMF7647]|uniref:Uncharacterized protein n=1 Tax=Hufsiella arboris TaxID=2695275 RepID=A0A7K1YAQ2_9SPHI|nr:hypothetical protein [Hufsiella arboris]MXV51500.1 hypothetical protein [Hufsiella arboris]